MKMETTTAYRFIPSFSGSYGTGWKVMTDNFLRLFLVVILLGILVTPMSFFNVDWKVDKFDFDNFHSPEDLFRIGAFGVAAAFMGMLGLLYWLFVMPVFKYGGKMMFVQSVRKQVPDFEVLISGFRKNYINIVLANLLVTALIGIGIVCLFIPGIIIACRLAFTPYLVMDKGLDPIKAAEESWRLTRGHGWTIFLMAFIGFFICIAGFICLFIGVLVSSMWIRSAYATLYQSVLLEKGMYQVEEAPVAAAPAPEAPVAEAPASEA
jgi:uncharacterized membrane protein